MKKYILPVYLGIIAGYVMYYYIVMEIVTMFCYSTQHKLAYQIICVVSLVATVALCSLVFFAIINRTLSQNLLRIVYVKVNIKLLFFGGVKCRFWANQSSPYHQTAACL